MYLYQSLYDGAYDFRSIFIHYPAREDLIDKLSYVNSQSTEKKIHIIECYDYFSKDRRKYYDSRNNKSKK